MARFDAVEMTMVERNDRVRIEPFRKTDYRGVGTAEGKVAIATDELRDAGPFRRAGGADIKLFQTLQKARFEFRALPATQEVTDLRNSHRRNCQGVRRLSQGRPAVSVIGIGSIRCREQRAAIHDRDRCHQSNLRVPLPGALRGSFPDRRKYRQMESFVLAGDRCLRSRRE